MTGAYAQFCQNMQQLSLWEPAPKLAVGLSGGVDSLCLTLWLAQWVRERGGALVALMVDHGLRAEAADELRELRAFLDARMIAHETLHWQGAKPVAGIQEAARQARYGLLDAACGRLGILHLCVAHHADDVRETLAMRQQRGSFDWGLAGIPQVRMLRHCRLLRPLLNMPKAALQEWMQQQHVRWWEDRTNQSECYTRNRLRLQGQCLPEPEPAARQVRMVEAEQIAGWAAQVRRDEDAAHRWPLAMADWVQQPAGLRLLGRVIQQLVPSVNPPRTAALRLVAEQMQRGEAWVLGGVRGHLWRRQWLMYREMAAVLRDPALLLTGYVSRMSCGVQNAAWQPLGRDAAIQWRKQWLLQQDVRAGWPVERLAVLPVPSGGVEPPMDVWVPDMALTEPMGWTGAMVRDA